MLNGGTLDGAHLGVTSPIAHADPPPTSPHPTTPIDQTDKPRSEIQHVYLRGAVALRLDIAQ